jgi:hypothetical protein
MRAYAEVAVYKAADKSDAVVGYAAPETGIHPCLLHLKSDGRVIAAGEAVGFSEDARKKGLRAGWCGFELLGPDMARALGAVVTVECAVSGRVLHTLPSSPPSKEVARDRSTSLMTVEDILALARNYASAPSIEALTPFARRHSQVAGFDSLIEASYLSLLGRDASPDDLQVWRFLNADPNGERRLLESLAGSEEFKIRNVALPGPYQSAFVWNRDLLHE